MTQLKEDIKRKIRTYLADEVYNSKDIEIAFMTTPIPEQANDILEIVLESLYRYDTKT